MPAPHNPEDLTYSPQQLLSYTTPQELEGDESQTWNPVALERAKELLSSECPNVEVGELYVGDCTEALDWAGDNVSIVIDASHRHMDTN